MVQPAQHETGARVLLVVACVVIVVAGLKAASALILPFLGALFLAMINLPLLNWLRGRRIPRPIAVVITLFAALSVLAAAFVIIGGSVRRFTAAIPKYKATLREMSDGLLAWVNSFGLDLSEQLPKDFLDQLFDPSAILDIAQGTLSAAITVLSNFFLVFLTIAFILFEAAGFPRKLSQAFGEQAGSERYEKIRDEIQKYLGIKTLVSLSTGGLAAGLLAVAGVDFPLMWGMVAFLLNYIPTLGSIIAAIPPVLLAAVQFGAGRALIVAAIFVGLNVTMGNLVEPYFLGRRLGMSTLVVFVSLVFWGWVWGPLGMLLSVPLTMIIKIMLENTEDLRWLAILLGPSEHHPPEVP